MKREVLLVGLGGVGQNKRVNKQVKSIKRRLKLARPRVARYNINEREERGPWWVQSQDASGGGGRRMTHSGPWLF